MEKNNMKAVVKFAAEPCSTEIREVPVPEPEKRMFSLR
jgi:hypothetical protein